MSSQVITQLNRRVLSGVWRGRLVAAAAVLVLLFLAFYNLRYYPTTWFDEGSHLQVPKTLVNYGVYGYRSSEGFRYYGPTVGVGPTVMLPVAAMFKVFGVGLVQARVVVACYMLVAILLFFIMAGRLGGRRVAVVATLLLVSSRGIDLVESGRQMLGEVPGLAFMLAGLLLWYLSWDKPTWPRLIGVGVLLGLASITKYQFFLVLAPTLLISWILNLVYYRASAQRVFLVPGIIVGLSFILWQICLVLYLGPTTAGENLAALREATLGAALVFKPHLISRALNELLGQRSFLGALIPTLVFGLFLAAPRKREAQKWGVLYVLIVFNFVWFAAASISWIRYAFPGLVFSALFVARFFSEVTGDFRLTRIEARQALRDGAGSWPVALMRVTVLAWLTIMICIGLGRTLYELTTTKEGPPFYISNYLKEHVPADAVVETWETEVGFLSDHNFHYPPQRLLNKGIAYVWLEGPSPSREYNFVQTQHPDYIVVGDFARWMDIYPPHVLAKYQFVTQVGGYDVYQWKGTQ
jgi:4-amino-4-deoxy-L-arabinose transferase-like glycosyltransferase